MNSLFRIRCGPRTRLRRCAAVCRVLSVWRSNRGRKRGSASWLQQAAKGGSAPRKKHSIGSTWRAAATMTIFRLLWVTVLALCLIRVSVYSRAPGSEFHAKNLRLVACTKSYDNFHSDCWSHAIHEVVLIPDPIAYRRQLCIWNPSAHLQKQQPQGQCWLLLWAVY